MKMPAKTASNGLEYFLKFPKSPLTQHLQFGNGDKIPLIILFGWLGCQDKHLAKYSTIYENFGLLTLRYCAPIESFYWRYFRNEQIGMKLLQLVQDLSLDDHPIVVHTFSNGGAFIYQDFVRVASSKLKLKGVIFDSGPGRARALTVYRSTSNIVGGSRLYNTAVSLFTVTVFGFVYFTRSVLRLFGLQCFTDIYETLLVDKQRFPQHFIYSKSDDLIAYRDVEEFMAVRSGNGVKCSSTRFEGSEHVKHLLAHRDVYTESILTFIKTLVM